MSFLDEAVYNVEKGAMPPDPKDLEDDDVVNIGEKSPDNLGYGIDPETGKFKSMSSNDAIKHFLAKVKQGVEDEGDEWPTLKEDLANFIRKAGGAQYKTPFTDFAEKLKKTLSKDDDDKDGTPKKEDNQLIKKIADIEKGNMSEEEFKSIVKKLNKAGMSINELKELTKRFKAAKKKKEKAAKKAAKKAPVKEETITGEDEGKPVKFKIKDITNLKDILNVSKSAKDFVNKISMAVTDETSSLSREDAKKLILFYKKRTMKAVSESKMEKEFAMIAARSKKSDLLMKISNELFPKIAKGQKDGKLINFKPLSQKQRDQVYIEYTKRVGDGVGNEVNEAEDIKLPSDTTFTVDLKHLVKKHMNKGNDKESAIKFTKALMKKLHNKGEVNVDGTKVIFKEIKMDQDVPLALPAAETPNFLGDDGMDYEGGMAKSQMLKMKKYVDALSNMIEDESQLESWVQAKLTKASDYMSAVYHYLDYQKSKMNELNEAEMSVNVNRKDDEVEVTYKGERYKSALGDELVFIHYFKDGEYHGENDAPKTFKYLKGKGGKLEVDEKEATLTNNMSNLK